MRLSQFQVTGRCEEDRICLRGLVRRHCECKNQAAYKVSGPMVPPRHEMKAKINFMQSPYLGRRDHSPSFYPEQLFSLPPRNFGWVPIEVLSSAVVHSGTNGILRNTLFGLTRPKTWEAHASGLKPIFACPTPKPWESHVLVCMVSVSILLLGTYHTSPKEF
jgi:hypothetical protein